MSSFPFVLLQFFGCLSISRLVNTGKNSNDFPQEITSFLIFFTNSVFISTFRLLLKNSANFSLQFKSLLTLLSHYKQANLTFSHHIFRSITFLASHFQIGNSVATQIFVLQKPITVIQDITSAWIQPYFLQALFHIWEKIPNVTRREYIFP